MAIPVMLIGRPRFVASCPAVLSAGAPWDPPANWPRSWSAPGGGSLAAEAVPTHAARAITAMPTAMRWRFMACSISTFVVVASVCRGAPERRGTGRRNERSADCGRGLPGTFETRDDAHQSPDGWRALTTCPPRGRQEEGDQESGKDPQ